MSHTVFNNALVFDGDGLSEKPVVVQYNSISQTLPKGIQGYVREIDASGCLIAPGLVDVQVNGAGGVLFNTAPTLDTLKLMAETLRNQGTTAFLPTFITDETAPRQAAMNVVKTALEQKIPGVEGLHLEGPYLNPDKKGMHAPQFMGPLDNAAELLKVVPPLALLTLAPEQVQDWTGVQKLTEKGVRLAMGHTLATLDEIETFMAHGGTGITHLYNAMDKAGPVVHAAHHRRGLAASLIVDGQHVDYARVRESYRQMKLHDNPLFLVSDALGFLGGNVSKMYYHGHEIHLNENGVPVNDEGRLAGANISLLDAVKNCIDHAAIPLEEALAMASRLPADFMGWDHIGRITPGARADLIILNEDMQLKAVMQAGEYYEIAAA